MIRTYNALAAAIVIASAAAEATSEPQTICYDATRGNLTILTSHEFAVLTEGQERPVQRPILTTYPDGRVETYRETQLPKEINHVS